MDNGVQISVVIPTRNRKARLVQALTALHRSTQPIHEVLVIDSSDVPLNCSDLPQTPHIRFRCVHMEAGVCPQRNAGIRMAVSPWVFLCDDDMEVAPDYLRILAEAVAATPALGAVSGLVLQPSGADWVGSYPLRSRKELLLKYVFGLGIWGAIECPSYPWPLQAIRRTLEARGNHLSAAGWPVLTDFRDPGFDTPLYTLGAALVRRDWLLDAPFDDVLDPHGIGDNFSVMRRFPVPGLRVITAARVRHHQEAANRLQRPLQYYRRTLALDYFRRSIPGLGHIRSARLLWSLVGNWLISTLQGDRLMRRAAWKSCCCLIRGDNPYLRAAGQQEQGCSPQL